MSYRFTKIGDTVADSYNPEVITSTDAEDIMSLLEAFKGFLVSCSWHPETITAGFEAMGEEHDDV